jgi:hypothetical protein
MRGDGKVEGGTSSSEMQKSGGCSLTTTGTAAAMRTAGAYHGKQGSKIRQLQGGRDDASCQWGGGGWHGRMS